MVKKIKGKSSNYKKIVGITMGDPGGVGPELCLSIFSSKFSNSVVLIGDIDIFAKAKALLNIDLPINILNHLNDFKENCINVFNACGKRKYVYKNTSKNNGLSAFESILKGIELALKGSVSALVTCPISKHGLKLANINFPGHTEILAHYTNSSKYRMLFLSKHFRVLLHTIHIPLKHVPLKIKEVPISETIEIGIDFLKNRLKILNPLIYVAGLNPHAGENGNIGKEEEEIIKPEIEKFSKYVKGPFPPDTVFFHALNNHADMIISMYHDQGLIPLKLLDFYNAVNLTLGIPFIRTSPDHGTAFDIAWEKKVNPMSFFEAVKLGFQLS